MKRKAIAVITLSVCLAVLTGCGDKPKTQPSASTATPGAATPKPGSEEKDDHDHGAGPHKGTIGEFGSKHIEFVVNHDTKEATIYILGGDAVKPSPIKAEKITLTIKEPAFKVELKAVPDKDDPAGKASRFVGKDDRFGVKQEFAGEVDALDDTKPYHGDFEEKDEKAAKEKKK